MLNYEYATGQLPKRIFTIFFTDSKVNSVIINFETKDSIFSLKIKALNNKNGEIECVFYNKTLAKQLWNIIDKFGMNGFNNAIYKAEFSMGLNTQVLNVSISLN